MAGETKAQWEEPEHSKDNGPGGVKGGRSHGGGLVVDTRGRRDGDVTNGSGALGAGEEQMGPGNIDGFGG